MAGAAARKSIQRGLAHDLAAHRVREEAFLVRPVVQRREFGGVGHARARHARAWAQGHDEPLKMQSLDRRNG